MHRVYVKDGNVSLWVYWKCGGGLWTRKREGEKEIIGLWVATMGKWKEGLEGVVADTDAEVEILMMESRI
jgi:hypothetical protein